MPRCEFQFRKISIMCEFPEKTQFSVSADFRSIQQVMKTNNQQACNKNHIHRKPDQNTQNDHTDANCPDYLEDQDIVTRIKCPCETHDQHFNQDQPEPPFY